MKKQLFKHLMGGMLMLAMPLMLTSCEGMLDDIFGEWSRPTGNNSTGNNSSNNDSKPAEDFPETSMEETPLTLVAIEDGKITVTFYNGIILQNDIHYFIKGGPEQTIAKDTKGSYDIIVKKGDVVRFYSTNTSLGSGAVAATRGLTRAVDSSAKYINIKPSIKTEIYGNVMSLLKGKDNLESAVSIEAQNAFYGLFAGADKLVNSTEKDLVLPATTLKEGCYQDMFSGCKGIEKAPELPAPALVKDCYKEMFYDCSKLNHVACLATDITATDCTKDWLGKAGIEATSKPVLESVLDMKAGSDDGVPVLWTAKKIVLVESVKIILPADFTDNIVTLSVGQDYKLLGEVYPSDATDPTITWTSSHPSVATVDANGTVHAVAAGDATITATAGDKTATCTVRVSEVKTIAVTSVTLTSSELTLVVGEADVTLTCKVLPDDADDKTVTWTSSNLAVATVDATGTVHAVAAGEATITAKAGEQTATCKITVINPRATITTEPTASPVDIIPGSTVELVTPGTASGGTMMYIVTTTDTKPTSTDGFSATVPTAASLPAGTYYVWYYVKADADHSDSEISSTGIMVTVRPS